MKVSELRLDNYILYNGKVIVAGDCWDNLKYGLSDHLKDKVTIEPIPLTEQWLKDFGFHNNDGSWFLESYHIHRNKYDKGWHVSPYADVEYIHQLQNLYFALTGEELTKD